MDSPAVADGPHPHLDELESTRRIWFGVKIMSTQGPCFLTDAQWTALINNIKAKECTPFLGAGACYGYIPLSEKLAAQWATDIDYPFEDKKSLVQVSQYQAIRSGDNVDTKRELLRRLEPEKRPNYTAHDEPLGILASLPIPLFITTNYDSLLFEALEAHQKQPKREICQWNPDIRGKSIFDTDYVPSIAQPLVYHLHGYKDRAESIVATEDDYIDFLVELSEGSSELHLLPQVIQSSLKKSLMFIGYSLKDLNLRVLLRGVLKAVRPSSRRLNVTLQLAPLTVKDPEKRATQQSYFEDYYGLMNLTVVWCNAEAFTQELSVRWKRANHETESVSGS
jgi:hypothetical protein